jgi:hypothetical protein
MGKKKKELMDPAKILKKLKEHNLEIQVGDVFIAKDGDYMRITGITEERIAFEEQDSKGEWSRSSSCSYTDFHLFFGEVIKVDKSYDEIQKDVFKRILDVKTQEPEPELSTSTAIIEQDAKKNLQNMVNQIEERRKDVELMKRILEKKRNQLQHMVSEMEKKVAKIRRVLCQIELYLGIDEDIIQLQEGPNADVKEEICLRQQILYMDEEYGAVENGGLDLKTVNEFDDWLVKDRHYERLAPDKKCVVVLRVRRYPKDYHTNNPLEEALLNQGNFMTYVLIRNGANIYRIYAQIVIQPRLFPLHEEIQKMYEDSQKDLWGFDKDDFEEKVFSYQQNFLLLQGLMDRTLIFKPLPRQVSLFKPESYEGVVKLIYDDEAALTEGRQYYKDWHKELNSKIKRGTRIYFCGFPFEERGDDHRNHRLQFPNLGCEPHSGIYSVVRFEEHDNFFESGEFLICHYNPKDEIWHHGWRRVPEHERMRSMYFLLARGDWWVLNYDLIDLDTVEYYINSRVDRENYLRMLPVLYEIKKMRLDEIKWEKGFVKSMALELECKEEDVWAAVDWWKHKVIWKRPIRKDDAKAWRMIKARLKRNIKEPMKL